MSTFLSQLKAIVSTEKNKNNLIIVNIRRIFEIFHLIISKFNVVLKMYRRRKMLFKFQNKIEFGCIYQYLALKQLKTSNSNETNIDNN